MSTPATRELLVEALDDLGERDAASYPERAEWDRPYPPAFVAYRLESLRRAIRWTRRFLVGLFVLLGGAAWIGLELGWGTSVVAYAIPLLLVPQGPTVYNLVRDVRAEQLYTLLYQLEGASEDDRDVSL